MMYLHRTVFFNSDAITDSAISTFINTLAEEEQNNAVLLSSFYQHVETEQRSFVSNWSVNFIWSLNDESDTAGESLLFSSWKTKVNRISRDVLHCEAIGFIDMCNDYMNIYK